MTRGPNCSFFLPLQWKENFSPMIEPKKCDITVHQGPSGINFCRPRSEQDFEGKLQQRIEELLLD